MTPRELDTTVRLMLAISEYYVVMNLAENARDDEEWQWRHKLAVDNLSIAYGNMGACLRIHSNHADTPR